jgi:dTDP-4-dehydrorhamnose 3,5-epimerase
MDKDLTAPDIDEKIRSKVYTQDYSAKTAIEGVKIFPLKNMVGEDGDFLEIVRFGANGTLALVPEFTIAQINHSTQFAGSVKAWHLHYKQNEIWFIPPSSHFLVGLWDVRAGSPTKGTAMRISMGGGSAKILFIPKGVAHGAANHASAPSTIIYFVDKAFDPARPDELRIPWDSMGADFWKAVRD